MKKVLLISVIVCVSLAMLDFATTMWGTSLGFIEKNQFLVSLLHTPWIFPVMVLRVAAIGALAIWIGGKLPKIWQGIITGGFLVYSSYLLFLVVKNAIIISGWSGWHQ